MANVTLTGYLAYSYGGPGLRLVSYEPKVQLSGVAETPADTAPTILSGISIPSGSVTLTGHLEYNYGGPGLRLTGFEPSPVVEEITALTSEPGAGSLTLAGAAPEVSTTANLFIGVDAGSLSIASAAPSILVSLSVDPNVSFLTITGVIPTLDQTFHQIRAPPAGSLALTGLSAGPAYSWSVYPSSGSLTTTGIAPALNLTANHFADPDAGSINVSGYAPTLDLTTGHFTVEPPAGALTLTGKAIYNYGGPGFRLIGYEPIAPVSVPTGLEVGEVTLSLTTHAPAIEIFIANADASLQLTGAAPTFNFATVIVKSSGTGAINYSGYAPVIDAGALVRDPAAGDLTLTAYAPERRLDEFIEPGVKALALAGYDVNYSFDFGWIAQPDIHAVTLAGYAATISNGPIIEPASKNLAITGSEPVSGTNWTIEPGLAAINLRGASATLLATGEVGPAENSVELTGSAPSLAYTWVTEPGVMAQSLTGTAPGCVFDWVISTDLPALAVGGSVPFIFELPGGQLVEGQTLEVLAESRTYAIKAENRTLEVLTENRLFEVKR